MNIPSHMLASNLSKTPYRRHRPQQRCAEARSAPPLSKIANPRPATVPRSHRHRADTRRTGHHVRAHAQRRLGTAIAVSDVPPGPLTKPPGQAAAVASGRVTVLFPMGKQSAVPPGVSDREPGVSDREAVQSLLNCYCRPRQTRRHRATKRRGNACRVGGEGADAGKGHVRRGLKRPVSRIVSLCSPPAATPRGR